MTIALATALCDPDAELLPKARALWPSLQTIFAAQAIHVTSNTHRDWLDFLTEQEVPIRQSAPAWDHIGLHRRRSLEIALAHFDVHRLIYLDPDHVLRWLERNPEELGGVVTSVGAWDCLVMGRSPSAFAAAPQRLRDTEVVVNRIYALMTGRTWDLMMAARGFTRAAAQLITDSCTEDTIGNDVAWPLLIEQAGMSLGYLEADGLTYETNKVYANDLEDAEDADPEAWMLRVHAAHQQIDAMRPFLAK
ncbi:MAG: hypothetical protein EP301_07420 [Gammaproteobacteria bacterium]|jgi:hypothetical protein|nr:MAG: hypothetical protein EP301_07420 [Gammaproteobacteria bacterium]